jgi:hypothetical protein
MSGQVGVPELVPAHGNEAEILLLAAGGELASANYNPIAACGILILGSHPSYCWLVCGF